MRAIIVTFLSVLVISGCADLSYYLHSVNGHYDILAKTRPIDEIINDRSIEETLVDKLTKIEEIRVFAVEQLGLPRSDSYTLYADLGRSYAVKNLFAAREFSIAPYRWCYPIVGCAGYRGYFDENRLRDYREKLLKKGFDVYVTNVSAYSTLGWFDDPVLNTFIHWPEHRQAGMIFHELAHQLLYVDGDSAFNESFAMAVQQIGVEKWLLAKGQYELLQKYRQYLDNRRQVVKLIETARQDLNRLYKTEQSAPDMRQLKRDRLQQLKRDYAQLSESFGGSDGFKRWFATELNNAKLASMSTYHAQIPAFRKLLKAVNGDLTQFYQTATKLAKLGIEQRRQCLSDWVMATPSDLSKTTVSEDLLACI